MGEVSAMATLFILVSLSVASVLSESPVVDDCIEPTPLCPENEEYGCRNSCPPETCITLYAAFLCVQNQTCNQGCFCKKGFLRTTTNGTCVPPDQCLPLECANDPNAQKGCGNRCGKTCEDYNDKSKICAKGPCKLNGCDCKPGYIYDKNVDKCVKPNECTKQCTKPNERYSTCLLGECVPKTCEDLGKSLPCPDIAPPCAGGCICDTGYVRDANGNCIDAKTCPSCGGDPNAQSGCGNPCGKTCASLNANLTNVGCPQYCEVNGCDCKDGYRLNTDTKKCTLIKDCPKPTSQCDKNEEYYCGPSCPEASCDNPNPPVCINKKCELKCYCKKGFVRDANKKCVPVNTCPVTCNKPHERYIDCLAGQCLPKTCDELGKPIGCPFIAGPCPGGCICEEGYLRNAEGACIKIEQCPPKPCGANQTWASPCSSPCNNQLCPRNDKETPPCQPIPPCYPGCQCKLNYRLNSTRHCILAPDCPPVTCTRQNEVWDSCPSACLAENCEDVNNQPKACNTLVWLCSPRCVCKKGHFRNKDGLCVPADQCTQKCTKPNEKYIDCLAGQCQPKTCKELQQPAPCPRVKPPCPGGCICIDGFVRDDTGACIKKEYCPIVCNGPNEQNSTCANKQCSPSTCKEVVKMPYCPPPNPGPCTTGCVCNRGFVRSSNGTCVAIKDCPEAGQCTSKNETWVQCAANCGPAYCPPNDQPQPICFLPAGLCQPGCHCKPNYRIDNKNKQCILASECPAVTCTRPNEVFSSCPSNRIMTCAALGTTPLPNSGPKICNPGCICKPDFYRNDNGTCVPKCECQTDLVPDAKTPVAKPPISVPRKCPQNEVLKSRFSCPPDTCDTIYLSFLCIANQTETVMCTCKDGYLRTNSTGVCVPVDRCLPPECANDPNAQRGCGNRCKKTCADYNDTKKVCANNVCKLYGCDCKDGFVYDENIQTCVKPSQCTKQCKKPHERYSSCLLGECIPKTCNDLGKPIACPSIAAPCAGGCICEKGYVRDSNGDCIEETKCPSCGGDPNAQRGCGNPCGKTCDSRFINKSELICPQYCNTNGCDCKPGFLLDTDSKKCVPEESCPEPEQCKKPNERYSKCLLGECVAKTCDDLGKPIACAAVAAPCAGGCICAEGFVRNTNGDCIDKSTCPSCGGDPNAQSGCGNPCGKTCASRAPNAAQIACPLYCEVNGCDCKKGFLLDTDSNKCVPEQSCPKPQLACSSNQTYVSCSVNCPDKYCPENDQPQPVCDPPRNCPPGCTCKINYRLNKSGQCILASECPPINCTRQNEEYDSCPSDCLSDRCEDADTPPAVCNTLLLNCQPKCVCKKNHYRNQDGLCVPAKDCPNVCKDPNAEWKDCKDACPGTCQNTRPICASNSKVCVAGCQCKDAYVLSKPGGECVKIDNCADYANCGANQTFVSCTFKCPQVMCPESDQTILCKPPRDCPGGCGCKPNYRYNADGECILGSDCPAVDCTRPNEEWSPCRSEYDWERCDDRYNSPPFVGDDDATCNPRCTCIKGYFKNNAYKCVPEKQCPPIS